MIRVAGASASSAAATACRAMAARDYRDSAVLRAMGSVFVIPRLVSIYDRWQMTVLRGRMGRTLPVAKTNKRHAGQCWKKTGRILGYALFAVSVICMLVVTCLCLAQREDSRTFVVTALVVNSSGDPMRNCFVSFTPKSSRRTDAMARYTGVGRKGHASLAGGYMESADSVFG